MTHHKQILPLLLVISACYYIPILKTYLSVYDEGIILAGAERILKGHRPYADFWAMYPPGQFYTLAFLFKIFGTSITVERIYDITVKSFLSIICFLISKKLSSSNRIATISWGMSLLWIGFKGVVAYPVYPALLFIFIGIYFFLYYLEEAQTHWIVCSGFFTTLGAMFRHDLAGIAALALLITLFIRKKTDTKLSWKAMLYYILAVFGTGLPVLVYLIQTTGIEPLVNQLIIAPAELIAKYRWLPYPSTLNLSTIQFFTFPLMSLIALALSSILIIKHKPKNNFSYGLFLLSLTGTLFVNQVRIRSDNTHLLPVALVGTVILPAIFYFLFSLPLKTIAQKVIRGGTACILVVMLCTTYTKPVKEMVKSFNNNYLIRPTLSPIEKAGYSKMSNDLKKLVLSIQKNTHVNDHIYVGVKNHDKFIISDVIIYFLADRNYSTKYHELHPGITNTPKIQKELISDIKHSSVQMVVLAPRYSYEPNHTQFDVETNLLDNYISENFILSKRYGYYEIWSDR